VTARSDEILKAIAEKDPRTDDDSCFFCGEYLQFESHALNERMHKDDCLWIAAHRAAGIKAESGQ
jgi:hypothetical protein